MPFSRQSFGHAKDWQTFLGAQEGNKFVRFLNAIILGQESGEILALDNFTLSPLRLTPRARRALVLVSIPKNESTPRYP